MGEISFSYNAKIKPIQETTFKYLFSNVYEYNIFYKRYIALSDTNILNNPIAINKVAIGFYNLYELFIDKKVYDNIYSNLINVKKKQGNTNINENIFLNLPLNLNIYKNYLLSKIDNVYNLNIYDNINTKRNNLIANKYKNYYVNKINETSIYINNYYLAKKYTYILNHYESILLKETLLHNTYMFNSNYFLKRYNYTNYNDNIFVKNINGYNNTNIKKDYYLILKNNLLNKNNDICLNINNNNLNKNNNIYLTNNKLKLNKNNIYCLVNNKLKLNKDKLIKLSFNVYNLEKNNLIRIKTNKLFLDINIQLYIQKYNQQNQTDIFKYNFINKLKNNTYTNDLYFNNLSKDNHNLKINNNYFINKYENDVKIYKIQQINKKDRNLTIYSEWFTNKINQSLSIFKYTKSIIKNKIFISKLNIEDIIKYNIPLDYINILFNNYQNTIIPISKFKINTYINNINVNIQKINRDIYINRNTTASLFNKNINLQNINLFCDKNSIDTYLDYKNVLLTKSILKTNINKDLYINKNIQCINYLNNNTFGYKNNKEINKNLFKDNWVNKDNKDIKLYQSLSLKKDDISIILYQNLFSKKDDTNIVLHEDINLYLSLKDINRYDSIFVDKNSQLCYYNYNETWFDKNIELQINNQLYMKIKSENTYIFDAVSSLIRTELECFYDYTIFSKTDIKQSNLFNHIQHLHDINKKAGIQLQDFGNWAWVYEPPDPFEGLVYGIDELLLPENDTRYEDFEDIIFDKENMVPKNPIKQINENTFVAKLPIKHPLPKYNDIAINYEKSAIDINQFHGIETKIVHEVFLKFYRLWYNKIFEFSTMTMTQSVKLMLEYMYAWIMEYYPIEQTEQALRVLKLIRWYGETSIIQNSQYIVSFEYDALYSKLNTGECLIPNDLDKDSNDTMYVDKYLGVIRNNPAYVGNTDNIDAYVTFYINNRKNTTFTFSLSNTVGSVNIYINDELVDTVSQSTLNLTYKLPYTGETNIVKIVKPAAHNLNETFFIGNIIVPNCTFKELNIEYDPTLKAGNKPLSDIAYKMVAYANIYEDREEIYEILRKSNLGNNEIYRCLLDYWNNHHSYKEKGKRLTIKEI